LKTKQMFPKKISFSLHYDKKNTLNPYWWNPLTITGDICNFVVNISELALCLCDCRVWSFQYVATQRLQVGAFIGDVILGRYFALGNTCPVHLSSLLYDRSLYKCEAVIFCFILVTDVFNPLSSLGGNKASSSVFALLNNKLSYRLETGRQQCISFYRRNDLHLHLSPVKPKSGYPANLLRTQRIKLTSPCDRNTCTWRATPLSFDVSFLENPCE